MITTYKFRTAFIFFLLSLLFTLALGNLFYVQIRQHDYFISLAEKQYFVTVTTYPPRAPIVDRNGAPLAVNNDSLTAFILPQEFENGAAAKKFLKTHFPAALERLRKNPKAQFLYVKRKLTKEEKELIESSTIKDIKILSEPSRFYPIPSAGSIIGLTNIDNQGLFGIELQFDKNLAGTQTTSILEKDARSGHFYFSKTTMQEGVVGTTVKLTIDSNLQFFAQEELEAQAKAFGITEGAALVIDPATGDILAMASIPTFNPNDTRELEMVTTKNGAVTESYEFGSAFKAFTALAALEEEVVTPNEEINCHNTKTAYIDGRKINTWKAHGILTFEEVIQHSNNIGIAQVAKRLDTKLYTHYKKLGFGTRTGIPFPGEQAGFLNPPENWSKQSIISLSYGYEVSTTLLRLTTAFAVFATNGYLITPRLVLEPHQYQKEPQKIYSDNSISLMRTILMKTASKEGTAHLAGVKGFTTLGKTSTANLLVNGQYDNTKNLYGFVGIVEQGDYKRVIGIILKNSPKKDLYSSTVAAPLFKKIAERLVIHDNSRAETIPLPPEKLEQSIIPATIQ